MVGQCRLVLKIDSIFKKTALEIRVIAPSYAYWKIEGYRRNKLARAILPILSVAGTRQTLHLICYSQK